MLDDTYQLEMARLLREMEEEQRKQQGMTLPPQQQPQQQSGPSPAMAQNFIPNSGGGGDFMAGAGPWAALAAAIAANEGFARDAGRRADNPAGHLTDALSGKVLEQDAEYYGDKIGGAGGRLVRGAGKVGHPEGQFEFAKKGIENMLTPWKLFS